MEADYRPRVGLAALTVVRLVTVVGVVMVIALLTLAVATAALMARRLWEVMIVAVLLSMGLTTAGLALSYGPDLRSGAVIVVLSAGLYLVVLVTKALFNKLLRSRRL